jgi:hypothetical protein
MSLPTTTRLVIVAAALAAAAFVAVSRGSVVHAEDPAPASGPTVSLYVVDHDGAQPASAALAPYDVVFRRVLAACKVTPEQLASAVFRISDQASMGSGVEIGNLAVLRGLARAVGVSPQHDCDGAFTRAESRLETAAFG